MTSNAPLRSAWKTWSARDHSNSRTFALWCAVVALVLLAGVSRAYEPPNTITFSNNSGHKTPPLSSWGRLEAMSRFAIRRSKRFTCLPAGTTSSCSIAMPQTIAATTEGIRSTLCKPPTNIQKSRSRSMWSRTGNTTPPARPLRRTSAIDPRSRSSRLGTIQMAVFRPFASAESSLSTSREAKR
jgi:hypothetical protein